MGVVIEPASIGMHPVNSSILILMDLAIARMN
jgi:hypothetical protein